jgi:hypothetical protein
MQYAGPSGSAPVPQYGVSGTTGDLAVDASTHGGTPGFVPFVGDRTQTMHLDVQLSTAVPITSLSVQTGAADAQLDLGSLRLNNLDVQVGAASAWIRLPETGSTTARVKGGAATITLEIPQGVAAQIHHRGGLSTFTIDQARFPQVDEGLYRSPDYDTAPNRVDLDIETGVTTIRVQ